MHNIAIPERYTQYKKNYKYEIDIKKIPNQGKWSFLFFIHHVHVWLFSEMAKSC